MSDRVDLVLEEMNLHRPCEETVARCICGWEMQLNGDDGLFVAASVQHRRHLAECIRDRLARSTQPTGEKED